MKRELKEGLLHLFDALDISDVRVGNCLELTSADFVGDLLKVIDEIKSFHDVVTTWCVPDELAAQIFSVITEVLCQHSGDGESHTDEVDNDSENELDESVSVSSSSCDELDASSVGSCSDDESF